MTTGTGFANINSATKSVVGTSASPTCNVEIQSFTFGAFSEKSDWTGPMVSTFTGEVYAEVACANLMATIQLMDCETATTVVTTALTLIAPVEGSLTWTFSAAVEAPNNFGYYQGSLSAFDGVNQADIEDADTDCALWSPPCYLDVVSFAKAMQEESLDHMKTHLTYNIELASHGDNACNTTSAVLTLNNGTTENFRRLFNA